MTAYGLVAGPRATKSVVARALAGAGRGVRRFAEALATPLVPEDFLDLIDPLRSGADLRGRVVAVKPEGPGATTVTIKPGRGWRTHTPGQYTRIGFDVDGVRLWRAYSMTSATPGDGTISVTIRAIPDGKVSNHVLRHLTPGTVLPLDQPSGDFILPNPAPASVLFLTAGSGITPIMGMLRNPGLPGDVVVVHCAPMPQDMLFLPELRELAARGDITLVTRFTATEGILPVQELDDVVPDWRERHTWACGPTALLDDAEAHWTAEDVAHLLHTERFRPAIHAVGDGGDVTYESTGLTVSTDAGTTLLDAGEDAGILMPSGCRMGICFNCVLPLIDGSVKDLRTGAVTTAVPEDPVLVQTCVSAAAGPCRLATQRNPT